MSQLIKKEKLAYLFFMGQVMQISGGKADPNTLKSKMEAAFQRGSEFQTQNIIYLYC